jgi:hypothetical protein
MLELKPRGMRGSLGPGSVDVLGRTVGGPLHRARRAHSEERGRRAGNGAVPYGPLYRGSLERR